MEQYKNIDLLCEILEMSRERIIGIMKTGGTKERAATYYLSPYYYCAVKKDRLLPNKLYEDDTQPTLWEKICFKQGRTLYRTLDGNTPPPEEPLLLSDTTFEWFIGPLSSLPDANTTQK
jgi:hypothetical protein